MSPCTTPRWTIGSGAVEVVLITAHDTREFREEAQRLGADGYLVKPVPIGELLAALGIDSTIRAA